MKPQEFKIELGVAASDVVSRFSGIVTGRAQYLTGCNQYYLRPRSKDGGYTKGAWFDENVLEIINHAPVVLVDEQVSGGPHDEAPDL